MVDFVAVFYDRHANRIGESEFPDPEPILTNAEKAEQLRHAHWPDADPTLTTIYVLTYHRR